MDLIKRNTDYAIRAMVYLAGRRQEEPVSAREISKGQAISYGLICKLLQRLQKNKLVKSSMGPKGGFYLNKKPSEINLLEITEAVQGPLSLNRCLRQAKICPLKKKCTVRKNLAQLQKYLNNSLSGITLSNLSGAGKRRTALERKNYG
jgi:Rrf2 family protein